MKCLRTSFLACLLAWAGGAAAANFDMGEALPYRLAGTLSTSDGAMAMIQMPGGEYLKVKLGDRFEDGVVEEITNTHVIVAVSASERWVLRLSGGQVEALETDEESVLYETTLTRFTDFGALRRKVDRAKTEHGLGKTAELGAALRAALGLPKQARVISVEETRIRSPEQLAQVLTDTLAGRHGVMVSVAGVKGIEQVYLSPSDEPTAVSSSD